MWACAVRAGEIVGIAGVSGNGQQELMAALSGRGRARPAWQHAALSGTDIARSQPEEAAATWACTSCPRSGWGAAPCPTLSLAQNTLLTRTEAVSKATGWLRLGPRRSALAAEHLISPFQRASAGGAAGSGAFSLSGGNLQKFIVGREIDAAIPSCC